MALKLTDEQKRMLDGELGEPVRQGMELTVQLADFWEAPDLIPVRSVHMPGASAKTARRAGRKYVRWCADEGGKFVTMTTLNTGAVDLTGVDLGISPETLEQQMELTGSYKRMGAIDCHTCTPFLIGNCPRFGEHVCWGESSAVLYANSILGARTNREGAPSALATALTGFTPAFGMHLQENRYATIHIDIDYPLKEVTDYACAGYYLAKNYPDALPVYTGFPARIPQYALKAVCASLGSSGSVSMFHAVGITPEAPTLDATLGGRKIESIRMGKKERDETARFLGRTNDAAEVDCAFMGCPHMDFEEVVLLNRLLKGRKVKSGMNLWLYAANSTWHICERSGLTKTLKDAGAVLVSDTCPSITILSDIITSRGLRSAATNSAKQAHYLPSAWGLNTHYGTTEECVEAAITGKWRV
jgi:predicted aconitase